MSDFGFDFEKELAGIRGGNTQPPKRGGDTKSAPTTPPNATKTSAQDAVVESIEASAQALHETRTAESQAPVSTAPAPVQPRAPITEGLQVAQSHQETLGGSGGSSGSDTINWKQFKTLPGIFEHVGGIRPVQLNSHIRKSQVSGMPEPMLGIIQERLQKKYTGAVVDFPWGPHTVTHKNRVFTTKASLIRYLLFDGFRDADGTHVQYAKQWLVLQHPAFDVGFNPDTHLGPTNDELDIYVLLYVAHSQAMTAGEYAGVQRVNSEQEFQTAERLGLINMGVGRVLEKLQAQEQALAEYAARSHMLQTVLLLDRMGLLKGGIPKDVGEFVRVLEQNRESVAQTGVIVDNHIIAEQARRDTLARDARSRQR